MNVALIQAGGVGKRIGNEIPKQFICINDKPIIIYTLEIFQQHPEIDSIVVVCLNGWHDVLKDYCHKYAITKMKGIIIGGETGGESIRLGINEIARQYPPDTLVLIHESVRPLVSAEIITDACRIAKVYGDSVAALACVDEIVESKDGINGSKMTQRDEHYSIQNPHTFPLAKLQWAYKEAEDRNLSDSLGTAVLMHELGENLHLSLGSAQNFKITVNEDMEIFKLLVKSREMGRI